MTAGTVSFDLVVIGAGPGGLEAALRARELGFKVALIEKSDPGGVCLNTGCIPTKAILASTKLLSKFQNRNGYGLSGVPAAGDWSKIVERKNQIVAGLKKGIVQSIRRSGVEWIPGEAKFIGAHQVTAGGKILEAENIIIAAGSRPAPFPGAPFDRSQILSSTGLLDLPEAPKQLLIIGGGVVGVEFASMFRALESEVTIVEMLERLIFTEDEEVGRRLEAVFKRKGIKIHTASKVKSLVPGEREAAVTLESGEILKADAVLVSVGRRPAAESLGLEAAGIQSEKGAILVNEFLETTEPGVFAIGDVTNRTTGLAHGASAEGIRVVENLKRSPKIKIDLSGIPNGIYSDPEVASAGCYRLPGFACPQEGAEVKVLFSSIGRAQAEGETDGFIKMCASKKTGKIIGMTGIGAHLTELIHEGVVAIEAGMTARELAGAVFAHPTEAEIVQRAARLLAQQVK